MTDKLSRDTWMICAALHLHLACKWELQEAAKYAQVMAEVYYDDPEYHNEDGGSYLVTKPDTIHAEPNLIAHAARRGISIDGGTVFLTHSPCMPCAALMIQAGIKEVYFLEEHRSYQETQAKYSNLFRKLEKWTQ